MLNFSEQQHAGSLANWSETFLKNLVQISSPSLNSKAVQQCHEMMAEELQTFGFKVELRKSPDTYGPLLLAERRGRRKEFVTCVSHADTVLPFEGFHPSSDPKLLRASGVIDNKGGITVALGGLREYLSQNDNDALSLRFVSSPNEEVGSVHWLETFRQLSQDSWMALGFEPALDDGSIIHARRGNRWYHVKVTGREAHAGRSYGEHVNAAHELAWKIHRLQKMTNYKLHRSVNVGALQGGRDKFNVVCGQAEAKIDVRFVNFRDRDKMHERILRTFGKKKHVSTCGRYEPETTFEILDDCPPFSPRFMHRRWIRRYVNAIAEVEGVKPASRLAGGAGDVNHFSRHGIIILDGLGPVGGNMHTVDEFINIPSLTTRAVALSKFLAGLS